MQRFTTDLLQVHHSKDLHIRIALEVPFAEFGKSVSLEHFIKGLLDNDIVSQKEFEYLTENDYEQAVKILQTNSFIVSSNSNPRLLQQRGAFILSPSVNIKNTGDIKTSILSKAKADLSKEFEGCFLILSKDKKSIREELDFFNVNEATLFPELEHQMRYIQKQTHIPVGTVEEYRKYQHSIEIHEEVLSPVSEENVQIIINTTVNDLNDSLRLKIEKTVMSIQEEEIDWQKKERAKSKMRRQIKDHLSDKYSAIEVENKTTEIIDKLLAVN
jgi:hypothetical protein